MFNFNNHEVVTNNKKSQSADIKVYAQNKVRFSEEALKRIGLTEGMFVVITQDRESKDVAIFATSRSGYGRKLTKDNGTTHEETAKVLGGRGAEWAITGDGQVNPASNERWFALTQTVESKDTEEVVEEIAPVEIDHTMQANVEERPNLTSAQGSNDGILSFD